MIPTCSNIQISTWEYLPTSLYRLSPGVYYQTWKHYAYSNCVVVPNNIKIGTISPSHHLNHFEHIEKKPIVEVSNKNGLKLNISSFQMVHDIGNLMNLCVLSSNGTVQKKQVSDHSPHLFKAEPNESPPIVTLHMNTLAQNGRWECQPRCNIFHHLASDLHTFHNFFALGDSQDTNAIAWWYNICSDL